MELNVKMDEDLFGGGGEMMMGGGDGAGENGMDAEAGVGGGGDGGPEKSEDTTLEVDPLTSLQQKLDEFAVMMYSFVGILQRDAVPRTSPPPTTVAPSTALASSVPPPAPTAEEEAAKQALAKKKEELKKQAVEQAQTIVRTAEEIDDRIQLIAEKVESDLEGAEEKVRAKDAESRQAGRELAAISTTIRQNLENVRNAFEITEKDDDARVDAMGV